MTATSLKTVLSDVRGRIETSLRKMLFEESEESPKPLAEAMEYACFPAGKRLRPVLTILTSRAYGGRDEEAMPAAVALEMIHCYSLVHDDLPAMDDDDLRRGRPTCHKAYGEAMAILAGDALLTRAFEVVARYSPPKVAAALTVEIARAAGLYGMVGGQAADLLGEGKEPTEARVRWIHEHKTGELIRVAVRCGARAAGASDAGLLAADSYGKDLGMAFQIVDDLLGRSGKVDVTGKPVGKDDARGKLTFPAAVGEAEAKKRVAELTERARHWAASFPDPAELMELAVQLRGRVS